MLKNIEVTQDLLDYIYNHTHPLHPVQKDILTHNKTLGDIQRMQISETQGHFLQLIIKISNVKNCLQHGLFFHHDLELLFCHHLVMPKPLLKC